MSRDYDTYHGVPENGLKDAQVYELEKAEVYKPENNVDEPDEE